jgi:hypothetical protein
LRTLTNETSQTSSSGGTAALAVAYVDALEHGHARVVANPRMKLSVAHVERDHACSATLEQHIREAAGRGPHVQRVPPGRIDAECLEGVRKLLAAA